MTEEEFNELRPSAFAIAYRMLDSIGEAEDVVQEGFLRHFFAAAEQGDLQGMEHLLAHDVQLTGYRGGKVPALARSLYGRDRVGPTLIQACPLIARLPGGSLRPVVVNGGPGAVFLDAQQRLIAVMALDTGGGQITSSSSIVSPDKLAHLGSVADVTSLLGSAR